MLPVLVTVTVPALPPLAPSPPIVLLVALPPPDSAPDAANPPLPPPPPIDCAKMPTAPSPCVDTENPAIEEAAVALVITVTLPAVLPDPPWPPTVFMSALPSKDSAAPTLKPPLPPPPPTDWA